MELRRKTKSDKEELLACEAAGDQPVMKLKDGALKQPGLRNSRVRFQKSKKQIRKSKSKREKQTAKLHGRPHKNSGKNNDGPDVATNEPPRRSSRLAAKDTPLTSENEVIWFGTNNARLSTIEEKRDFLLAIQDVEHWSKLWDWCAELSDVDNEAQYPTIQSMSFDMQHQPCLDALLVNHVCIVCKKQLPHGVKVIECPKCARWAEHSCVENVCGEVPEDDWICQHCVSGKII